MLVGGSNSPDKLTKDIGFTPDEVHYAGTVRMAASRRQSEKDNSWAVVEAGDSATDVSVLLERLYARLYPFADTIQELSKEEWTAVIRVVQYMSGGDPVGPGFVVGREMLAFLGHVGAFLDVDLYVTDDIDD